jgi:uncharacterized protein YndB with AHSA1/START domain
MADQGDHVVEFDREFRASRADVFAAFVDREAVLDWWAPRGWFTQTAEMDVRVGGKYRFGMRSEEHPSLMHVSGEYLDVDPPRLLRFTYVWEPGGAGERWRPHRLIGVRTTVTLEFIDLGKATRVRIRHEGFPSSEAAQLHRGGWSSNWDCLEEYLAGGSVKPHRRR